MNKMNIIFRIGIIVLFSNISFAQINGITESGDEVYLYDDGTWSYVNDSIIEDVEINFNEQPFLKDEKSTFLVKSKKLNIGVWMNPKEWTFNKGGEKDEFEFQFRKKEQDLYAMILTEKIQIPIETLKGIALENAKRIAADIKSVKTEYRIVNGNKVLLMQMVGTIQGMDITYYGYYYSNVNGTVQFITYTGLNLIDEYLEDIELLINGLTEY